MNDDTTGTRTPDLPIFADTTLNSALQHAVTAWPDRPFLRIDGRDVTFAQFDDAVGRLAAGLRARFGIGSGDRVAVFLRNSLLCEHTWFAANRLGAVWVPINTEFRGLGLENAVRLAEATVIFADPDLRAPLEEALASCGMETSVVVAHEDGGTDDRNLLRASELYLDTPVPPLEVAASDLSALLYTSGTTGRSKACMLSHRYFVSQASIAARDFGLTHDDVLYCPFPLFHADATALTTVPALLLGATAAIGRRFSASRFWQEVRETGATVFDFMGATLSILWKAEPRPDDADNPVRLAWGVPVPDWAPKFEERFGLTIVELYGSVEANIPVTQRFDQPRVTGSCGRVTPDFEIRIADDQDHELPANEVGELLIRPRHPDTMFSGYHSNPLATVAATRNLWFHSGDLAWVDEDGNVYFVGRKKEAIRRRGENISAFEVEEGVRQHPAVLDCAAFGVPSELTEEEIKIAVVAKAGHTLSAREIWDFTRATMARFQVPRYVEIVPALPVTPTGKVEKFRLQEQPFTQNTHDFQLSPSDRAAVS
ncbi:AMP-binding protein [Streptomyces violaceusniger]|uniref:ATP-dependent acyl-CoA ligase n=1 Tax=Streptomyces violaceusniger TaxID=68280 RepID=A0A4D4KNF2_STRVO|nr:ATP-dependent acyl-CoA ligase [Streptomyces violaceusniger]